MPKINPFPGLAKEKRRDRKRPRRSLVSRATFIQRSRSESAEQKAIWHNVSGAGPRGILRKFFDLNDSDKQACSDGLTRLLAARVQTINHG